uniref:Uncharacterized protein n=1 Tax=Trichinella nativa TaxID=6335 RepID=A0A0V1KDW9_9BILA
MNPAVWRLPDNALKGVRSHHSDILAHDKQRDASRVPESE